MITTDLANYLANDGIGTYGLDIVDTEFPEDLDSGLLVRDYPGRPGEYDHSQDAPVVSYTRVQVAARDSSVENAYTLAETAYGALVGIHNLTIGGTRYGSVQPLQRAFWLRRDDSGRHYVIFNAEVSIG